MNILSDGGLDRLPGDRRAGQYDPLARARERRPRLHLARPDAEALARQLHGRDQLLRPLAGVITGSSSRSTSSGTASKPPSAVSRQITGR